MKTATMEKITFDKWEPADYINTKKDVIGYLEAALEENNTELLLTVIGDIARSKARVYIAKDVNNEREGLCRSLSSENNPSLGTIVKLLDNLGFQLSVKQKEPAQIE